MFKVGDRVSGWYRGTIWITGTVDSIDVIGQVYFVKQGITIWPIYFSAINT